jgi:uncharacterized protein (TIGR02118 family)
MIVVSVMYPYADGSRFDLEYYMQKHIPLVQRVWGPMGLVGNVQVLRGVGSAAGGQPDFQIIANLSFTSLEQFQLAGKAHGREVMGDIANFTNVEAVIQFSEIVG